MRSLLPARMPQQGRAIFVGRISLGIIARVCSAGGMSRPTLVRCCALSVQHLTNCRANQCHTKPYYEGAAYEREECEASNVPIFSGWLGQDINSCKQRCEKEQCQGGDDHAPKGCASRPAHSRRIEQPAQPATAAETPGVPIKRTNGSTPGAWKINGLHKSKDSAACIETEER